MRAENAKQGTGNGKLMKGQGSTEYLVVLAVVLVVAIIVVALLGGFVSFAPSAGADKSQLYWQGATPFSIEESQVATENVTNVTP